MSTSLPAAFISIMCTYVINPLGANPQLRRPCMARCAWGRRGGRWPWSLPRTRSRTRSCRAGPGAPRAAAEATFPLLLAPSRGPPQKAQLRRPRSACTAAAPGIPPLRGPPAPGSPLRLLAVIQLAEWVGNETAVWAVVLGQAHRSPCKVKI